MWSCRRIQTHILIAIAILWLIDDSVKISFARKHNFKSGMNDHRNTADAGVSRKTKKSQQNSKTSHHENTKPRTSKPNKSRSNYLFVELEKGKYRGKILNILDTRVGAFLGMRYGQSAAGDMRFRKPKPVTKWQRVHNALEYPNSCYQWIDNTFGEGYAGTEMWNPNTKVSEDCLFLNVWTPLGPDFRGKEMPVHKKLLPVMVWIYGGGFYSGTSSLNVYQGQWLAASHEIVVVSMNYRVAAFGFLTFGTKDAPGNEGLWDQNLALQWVHENIHNFGGDKSRITLFGESAGAASVSLHMLSKKSNTLFNNAILQSASVVSPWAVLSKSEMISRANKLAKLLNCSTQSNESVSDALSCLKKKDAKTIVNEEIAMTDLGTARFQNAAIIDGDFLTEEAIDELKNGTFSTHINILGGFNANEGNYFLVYTTDGFSKTVDKVLQPSGEAISYSQYRKGLNRGLWGYPWAPYDTDKQIDPGDNSSEIVLEAIDFQYTDFKQTRWDQRHAPNEPSKNGYKAVLDHIVGDINFVCPTIDFMKMTAISSDMRSDSGSGGGGKETTKGKKYLYKFLHRSSRTPWPEWMGTLHGYEIEFAFGIPLNNSLTYTSQEKELSKLTMKYWTNFAKTGDPNMANIDQKPEEVNSSKVIYWPQYDSDTGLSMVFDIGTTKESGEIPIANVDIEMKTKDQHCKFWSEYYPVLSQEYIPQENCWQTCPSTSGTSATTTSLVLLLTIIVAIMYAQM